MSSPIKAKDFEKDQASNDEEAFYIAVEAIENDEFERLPFSKKANVIELRHKIISDPRFEEIKETITGQNLLLNSVIANRTVENDDQKMVSIQERVLEEIFTKTKSEKSIYKRLSVAASVLIVCLIAVLAVSYALNKNDKNSTTTVASKAPVTKKQAEKADAVVSTLSTTSSSVPDVGSDTESGAVSRDSTNLPSTSSIETSSTLAPQTTSPTPLAKNAIADSQEVITTPMNNNTKHIIEGSLILLFILLLLLIRVILKKTKVEE